MFNSGRVSNRTPLVRESFVVSQFGHILSQGMTLVPAVN
jgi:hypothetical protein